jgi:hypothetical protein
MTSLTRRSTRLRQPSLPKRVPLRPSAENVPQGFRVHRDSVLGALPTKGKTMQHKKTQVAPNRDRYSPLLQVAGARFGERSSRETVVPDLKSIVSAAHKLPAEVAPPARAWRSLRAQLEKEGILSSSMSGILEEHTRFPMFRN